MNAPLHLPLSFFSRRFLSLVLIAMVPVLFGCAKKEAAGIDAKVVAQFNPHPPVIGTNLLELSVTDANGEPIQLGMIKVEANMNHAGMKPVFAELMENDPGEYAGTINFTMGGDWFLLVTSEPSPEGALNQKINVPGVKAK